MVLWIAALCSLAYGYQSCRCAKTQTVSHQSITTEVGFNPRLIHVGLVVDKVANNKGFLQVIQFSFVRIISPTIHPSWILYNLDIFPIIYTHTLLLGLLGRWPIITVKGRRGDRTWFFLNTSIHVHDSTVSQYTRPYLNIPCHENVKTNNLTDIIALSFKHHKNGQYHIIFSERSYIMFTYKVVVSLIYSTISRSLCVFINVAKWEQLTLDRLWMWKSLIF
jgi:hypothetical protein